jgi:hypothetical protein
MDLLWIAAFVAAWVALQAWVLPRMGIPTCMSGGCPVERAPEERLDRR